MRGEVSVMRIAAILSVLVGERRRAGGGNLAKSGYGGRMFYVWQTYGLRTYVGDRSG